MAKRTDLVGNPLRGQAAGGTRKASRIPTLRVAVKRNAVPLIAGAVAGAASTGVALAIVSKVPMLRDWAASGGFKRAAVVTGVSVGVAGLGLLAYGKITTPRRAIDAAPFVVGGALLTAMAPVLASEIVARIDSLLQGLFNGRSTVPATTTPSGAGNNNGGALGPRRALTAAEVRQGEAARTRVRVPVPETVDMHMPRSRGRM